MRRRSLFAAVPAAAISAILGNDIALGTPVRVSVEMSVIHAMQLDGGVSVDPKLRDLPQLTKQQPFVRYNVFKLLDRKELSLEKGQPVDYGLLDGRRLRLTLVDVTAEDAGAGQTSGVRYQVRAEIGGPPKKEFLKLLEVSAGANEPFFVGGQSYRGGTLFLELVIQ
jgi:hypothetical protein